MTVEELNVIITAQNTEFNRRLDEVNNRLDDMADTAQSASDKTYSVFRGLASKLAALGIGKFIANSITEGMNAVESESLFETSLGKYADSAREWSERVGNALGLDDGHNSIVLKTLSGEMVEFTEPEILSMEKVCR